LSHPTRLNVFFMFVTILDTICYYFIMTLNVILCVWSLLFFFASILPLPSLIWNSYCFLMHLNFFLLLVVLGFEHRASPLLGRY
jgi:hypothetical protein